MNRSWVNKRGLDLSKEVLWVSVGQRAAELPAIKVGGLKKILPNGPARVIRVRTGPLGRIFFWPPTLMAGSSAALWPTETHSTSLERSKPPLLTQALFKSLEALLMYFISIQSTLISIVFISKGAVFVGPLCTFTSRNYIVLAMAAYWWGISSWSGPVEATKHWVFQLVHKSKFLAISWSLLNKEANIGCA